MTLLAYTLSSGPESGLCNQLYALIGYALIAKRAGSRLAFPNFTSHDNYGVDERFEVLFELEPFAASLKTIGVDMVAQADAPKVASPFTKNPAVGWRPWKGGKTAGWIAYKQEMRDNHVGKGRRGQNNSDVEVAKVERAVLGGLRPASEVRVRTANIQRQLGSAGAPYGCLHARIEADMVASQHANRAGAPPSLDHLLDAMERVPAIRGVQTIFVAVGLAISGSDNATLSKPTRWNATLVRTSTHKAWHRGQRGSSEASYTLASLVDLSVCRAAAWFVGWPGSTFARTLGWYRQHDRGEGWSAACSVPTLHSPTPEPTPSPTLMTVAW